VTDWNLTAIRASQAAGQPNPMFARNLAMGFCQHSRHLGFFRLAVYTYPSERRG
jgi:hypothetical protein